MQVLVLANSRSGKGKSAAIAERLTAALTDAGHHPVRFQPAPAPPGPIQTDPRFADADAVVAVGGDGTVYHALPQRLRSQTPVYHAPGGNENLFAREFGMTADPANLLRALNRGPSAPLDVGTVTTHDSTLPFAIMLSIGPDASVIHRLHAHRTRASGHAMYLAPTLAECRDPHLPVLTIRVDGQPVVTGQRGFAIVANCRRYALGLDPARNADVRDGRLDLVFFPAASIAGALLWMARCMLGDPLDWRGVTVARGTSFEIDTDAPAPWQVDGEAGGWTEPGEPLCLGVRPGALHVLSAGP